MTVAMTEPPLCTRRFKRVEYERLVETGFFRSDERLELIDGALVVREPQGSLHAVALSLAADTLRETFHGNWHVRVQSPIALDDFSEPEPDIAVVAGAPPDYMRAHPSRPLVLVEVSEASLALDRGVKGGLYARAGVMDFWIVNLVDRVVEVYREPVAAPAAPYGARYASVVAARAPEIISPLASPYARIAAADLLP